MLKLIFITTALLTTLVACSEDTIAPNEDYRKTMSKLVNELVADDYSHLKGVRFSFRQLKKGQGYYLQSYFKKTRFLGKHEYVIKFHPDLFQFNCPAIALKSILAHELEHTTDYYKMGKRFFYKIISLGYKVSIKKKEARYERRTDLKAIGRGHGIGLEVFREWLYKRLTPEKIENKKYTYLTLEEIDHVQNNLNSMKKFLKNPLKILP